MARKPERDVRADLAGDRRVSLSIPLKPEYAAICRLAVAGLANLHRLDQETVGDLKVAVTEACSFFIRPRGGDDVGWQAVAPEVCLDFDVADDTWAIEVSVAAGTASPELLSGLNPEAELGLSVIRALLDSVDVETAPDGRMALKLVKQV
ncbi:MAG: ATP-binding protein [Thermoleophilia bacterium]|nr:ATP-binding protein [Thermoleophilia bacterium]